MEKFTWVPIYKEIASKLLDYRDRQEDLLKILADLQEHGLPTCSLKDKNAKDEEIPLTEIDPFTFFANFNRGIKEESRIAIIKHLKTTWSLTSAVPTDFLGTPVVNPMMSWFFSFKKNRGDRDIAVLWELFEQAMADRINPQTFNTVLNQRVIKFNITMALFWISPDRYLNLDSTNRSYLAEHEITVTALSGYEAYLEYMRRTRSTFHKPFFEISHDAWRNNAPQPQPRGQHCWLYAPGRGGEHWEEFYLEGIMAIGWDYLEDLRHYSTKEDIAQAMRDHDNELEASKKNNATSCFSFCYDMKPGDIVYAKIGKDRIVGRGIILSEYEYDKSRDFFKHVRKVEWQQKGAWRVAEDKRFALKTITDVTTYREFIKYLNSLIVVGPLPPPEQPTNTREPLFALDECVEAIGFDKDKIISWKTTIERKKQAIFYGPPGTGKTYIAEHLARHIVSGSDGFVECIQFHPAYTYEEFIQGIRPETDGSGNLQFQLKPGRFLEFCSRARERKGPCVLIIDEINRANIARVFGELMYLLEYRDKGIPLASGDKFSIPDNVRIIGTMNTADRSIALVDFALRRRFAFLELSPEYDVLTTYQSRRNFDAAGLIQVLRDVNSAINDKNFHIGISFFMIVALKENVEEIWRLEIEPYLEEYFFSQPQSVEGFRWDKIRDRILR